jgi:hypothetical protein
LENGYNPKKVFSGGEARNERGCRFFSCKKYNAGYIILFIVESGNAFTRTGQNKRFMMVRLRGMVVELLGKIRGIYFGVAAIQMRGQQEGMTT